MSEQLVIESPDFDQIRKESGRATEDSIRLLWYALNEENSQRRKQRWNWVDVEYSTITFSASAGTWTVASGDLFTYRYTRLDDMVIIFFNFTTTSTSAGMGTELYFTLPYGLTARGTYTFLGPVRQGGAAGYIGGYCFPHGSNRQLITLIRDDNSAWPSSRTDDLSISGSVIVQVA